MRAVLQKAGRHMEDTLIAAYTALLTGYCIMDNKVRRSPVASSKQNSCKCF